MYIVGWASLIILIGIVLFFFAIIFVPYIKDKLDNMDNYVKKNKYNSHRYIISMCNSSILHVLFETNRSGTWKRISDTPIKEIQIENNLEKSMMDAHIVGQAYLFKHDAEKRAQQRFRELSKTKLDVAAKLR